MKNRVYIILTYLLLISLAATGISMSCFKTTMTASGGAIIGHPVIDYVPVSATMDGEPITISGGIDVSGLRPGSEMVYHFNVNNYQGDKTNEVLLKYKISVIFDPDPQKIPLTCTLEPDDTYQSAGDGWVMLGFESEETHSHTLTVSWDESEDDPVYLSQQQRLKLVINTEQVIN